DEGLRLLARREFYFRRQGRAEMWLKPASHADVDRIEKRQHQPRQDASKEQVSDRDLREQAVEDEGHARRDEGTQGSARSNGADGDRAVILVFHHRWVSDLAHRDGGGRRDPCNRREDRTNLYGAYSQSAANMSDQLVDSVVRCLGNS